MEEIHKGGESVKRFPDLDYLEAFARQQIAEPAPGIGVTFFPTYAAQSQRFEEMTLEELRDKILSTTAESKAHLPWLKLARFGEERTDKNSLRSNKNTLGITGVETDYDQGKISFEKACSILADAGIHALVYTSASHKPDHPKWRILAPTSKELPPAERLRLVERLSGLFGGVFDGASFTLSQSYYFGAVDVTHHRAEITAGDFIDERADLDAGVLGKTKDKPGEKTAFDFIEDYGKEAAHGKSRDDVAKLTENTLQGEELHDSIRDLAMHHIKAGMEPGAVVNFLRGLMNLSAAKGTTRWQERYDDIPRAVDSACGKTVQEPPKLETLTLSIAQWRACNLPALDPLQGEVLTTTTRMLLAGDTGLGKSLMAIALGMHTALGFDFLHWGGMRTARVLYIDGEMSRRTLKKRLIDEANRIGQDPETFFALSSEEIEGFQPLNTRAGQKVIEEIIEKYCGGVDLIIFDNIMALISGNHSEEQAWSDTLPWIRSLTKRAIGQIWVHHTGQDTSRQYGTKTREWQMESYVQLDKIENPQTDVSFLVHFRKARERNPENRSDFADVQITLEFNKWKYEIATGEKKQKPSPVGQKFYECLLVVVGKNPEAAGTFVATLDAWFKACVSDGLVEPQNGERRAQMAFTKYKLELISRNWIKCDEQNVWLIP